MQPGKMAEQTTTERFMDYHVFCWERFEKVRGAQGSGERQGLQKGGGGGRVRPYANGGCGRGSCGSRGGSGGRWEVAAPGRGASGERRMACERGSCGVWCKGWPARVAGTG